MIFTKFHYMLVLSSVLPLLFQLMPRSSCCTGEHLLILPFVVNSLMKHTDQGYLILHEERCKHFAALFLK